MKIFNFLLVLVTAIFLSSCYDNCENGVVDNCIVEKSCSKDSDCGSESQICDGGVCDINYCNVYEPTCGRGKCIPGYFPEIAKKSTTDYGTFYICECDEDAVAVGELGSLCVPTCNTFSQECRDFDKSLTGNGAFDDCNIELGRCDQSCQGEGSCEEGYYCSSGGKCRVSSN